MMGFVFMTLVSTVETSKFKYHLIVAACQPDSRYISNFGMGEESPVRIMNGRRTIKYLLTAQWD